MDTQATSSLGAMADSIHSLRVAPRESLPLQQRQYRHRWQRRRTPTGRQQQAPSGRRCSEVYGGGSLECYSGRSTLQYLRGVWHPPREDVAMLPARRVMLMAMKDTYTSSVLNADGSDSERQAPEVIIHIPPSE